MVEDVEELRTELHRETLGDRELLEHRKVKAMEARPDSLARLGAESGRTIQREAAGDRGWIRSNHSGHVGELAGLVKGCRVVDPERTRCAIDHFALNAQLGIADLDVIALAGSGGCRSRAGEVERLAALQSDDPVCGPAA